MKRTKKPKDQTRAIIGELECIKACFDEARKKHEAIGHDLEAAVGAGLGSDRAELFVRGIHRDDEDRSVAQRFAVGAVHSPAEMSHKLGVVEL